jgi:hypothetical protein
MGDEIQMSCYFNNLHTTHYKIKEVHFHNCVALFLGLYEPRKPSRRRHFGKRDTEQVNIQLASDISEHKRIDKREVQDKQIVSITLGVRGLMVGSDADLQSHGLTKRDTVASSVKKSHVTSKLKSNELPTFPLDSFTTLSAIIGSATVMLLLTSAAYFLAKRDNKRKQAISTTPQLLNK